MKVRHVVVRLGRVLKLPDRGCGLVGLAQVHVVVDVVHHTLDAEEVYVRSYSLPIFLNNFTLVAIGVM